MKSTRIVPALILLLLLTLVAGCGKPGGGGSTPSPTPAPTPTPAPSGEVTKVELSESTLLLPLGKSHKLTVKLTPADAASKEVTWSSSDDKVATVSDGEVAARGEGVATITVAHTKSGLSASCKVTVSTNTSVTDISGLNL